MAEYCGEGTRVLVVEDDDHVRRLFQAILDSVGCDVSTATNGAEALERLKEEQPDVIILDVVMPVMDGLTCLSRLKNNARTSHIPTIMTSASLDRNDSAAAEADEFLPKPFSADELIELIGRFGRPTIHKPGRPYVRRRRRQRSA